SIRGLLSGSK
ncbi:unnamed protein product, partial [Callosobruchus maculatus]